MTGPEPDPKELEDAFRSEVLKLLRDEGKIYQKGHSSLAIRIVLHFMLAIYTCKMYNTSVGVVFAWMIKNLKKLLSHCRKIY